MKMFLLPYLRVVWINPDGRRLRVRVWGEGGEIPTRGYTTGGLRPPVPPESSLPAL
jgi:hypothetical protein